MLRSASDVGAQAQPQETASEDFSQEGWDAVQPELPRFPVLFVPGSELRE